MTTHPTAPNALALARQPEVQVVVPKIESAFPMTPFDIRHYKRLVRGTRHTAKSLWRIHHTIPYFPNGRISDFVLRLWWVASTRIEGLAYEVNLIAMTCRYWNGRRYVECPDLQYNHKHDEKKTCCHIQAALARERVYRREGNWEAA